MFHYEEKIETVLVKNSNNINKTKESLISDGHEFHQYQQNKQSLITSSVLNTKKNTPYYVENSVTGLGQAPRCGIAPLICMC